MITPTTTTTATQSQSSGVGLFRTADGKNYLVTFVLMSSLFLLWGFCSGLLDNLNKHFQNTLHISKFKSGFVQHAFYMGYFIMALPAGAISRRFGYKGGIIAGLFIAAAGAFWLVRAGVTGTYYPFLFGLFVLASGLACLEANANPYTTVLGPVETGPLRINMAQTCNGLGWISGMLIGAYVIFPPSSQIVNAGDTRLSIPYLGIGIAIAVLLAIFIPSKVPDLRATEEFKAEFMSVHTLHSESLLNFSMWLLRRAFSAILSTTQSSISLI
jgi:FHS family L-fucose permease-like MFS transporter